MLTCPDCGVELNEPQDEGFDYYCESCDRYWNEDDLNDW